MTAVAKLMTCSIPPHTPTYPSPSSVFKGHAPSSALLSATKFGASSFLSLLLAIVPMESIEEEEKQKMIEEAVLSDQAAVVAEILKICPAVPQHVLDTALARGVTAVTDLLLKSDPEEVNRKKEELQTSIINNTADLYNQVPKSKEYIYTRKIDKLVPKLTGTPVAFLQLLALLLVQKVHVGKKERGKEEWTECPPECEQKNSCRMMREVMELVKLIVEQLGACYHPVYGDIFRGIGISLIGKIQILPYH